MVKLMVQETRHNFYFFSTEESKNHLTINLNELFFSKTFIAPLITAPNSH